MRARRIDVDAPGLAGLAVELASGVEDEVLLRGGARLVPRLQPVALLPRCEAHDAIVRTDGSYLVTGGMGEVGRGIAAWLAARGAGRIVLCGRSVDRARGDAIALGLGTTSARIEVRACDVRDAVACSALVAEISGSGPPLRGVIHAAGLVDDGLESDGDEERIAALGAPKAAGFANLDAALRGREPEWVVAVSSAAALLGSPGQAAYAAANAAMESLARARNRRGRRTLAVGFGPFDAGMAARSAAAAQRFRRLGLRPMTVAAAFDEVARLLALGVDHALVFDADWPRLVAEAPFERLPERLAGLAPAVAPAARRADELAARFRAGGAATEPLLLEWLRETAARILQLPPAALRDDEPLIAQGLDSLGGVEIRNAVQRALGLPPPLADILANATPQEIAARLAAEFPRA